ncbi:MAG: mechanosensitive ion channel [Butyribacter sp.]|nr:mechanosensitive ion channel [bacterium]MDY3853647.1 mechanosensitive ion channel [Butyribacter sp.]
MEEVVNTLNSAASSEEKTNFIIEYLLSQRGVLLDGLKTILFALIVYLIGRKIVKFCLKLTKNWMERRDVEISVRNFVMSFAKVLYHLILIFIVAGILGVGATIVAIISSAGLALGLALQGSLSNLAAGILILALKPFKAGDYILVAGAEGTVESIDIFYTRIHTTDNKIVVVPNGTITNQNITNTTNASKRMLILDFRVPYQCDVEKVKEILFTLMREETLISDDEPMDVVINKLSPVKLQMQLKAWTKTEDYWDVRYRMLEKMKKALQENGIEIS